jgi:hypothetical protein
MSIRINRTIAAAVVLLGVMGCSVHRVSAQTGTLTPTAYQTVLDSNGAPIAGACVWTYLAGTSTPTATYTSKAAGTPNTNPIVADSAGQFVAYLLPGSSYKFVYEAACAPPAHASVLRTQDGIDGMYSLPLGSFVAGVTGDESVTIRNTSAGAANRGVLFVGNDASATLGTLAAHSSTFSTSGAAIANGVKLTASGVGGLSLQASDATGIIHFFTGTGTTERGQITASGLWNWSAFGTHQFAASGTGAQAIIASNSAAGTGNYAQLRASSDTVLTAISSFSSTYTTAGADFQGGTTLFSSGVGGMSINAAHGSGAVRFYTGGASTPRWGINAAGDLTQGSSSNIIDSVGVPSVTAGCGTGPSVVGNDYLFTLSTGSTSSTTCTVGYGHIMSAASCTANATTAVAIGVTGGAAAVIFTYASATALQITAICRGR